MSGFFHSDRAPLAPPISATIYEGRVARVHEPGDALIYATGPEHRDSGEVQRIVDQLPGLKVYLGHPSIPAEQSGQIPIGYVESGRLDDDSAVAKIVITDKMALDAIQAGTHELSLGYACKLDEKRYQRGVTLDHLAIVELARCGAACSMRVDTGAYMKVQVELTEELKAAFDEMKKAMSSAEMKKAMSSTEKKKCECEDEDKCECESKSMKMDACTCKNRATPYNSGDSIMSDPTTPDLAAELAALKAKLDEAHANITKLEVEATNARKDAEALQGKLDAAQTEVSKAKEEATAEVAKVKADAQEALDKEVATRVDARVDLIIEAKKILGDADLSKMNDREIKCAVIKHVDGDEVPAEKSMDYVSGVYEGALKRGLGAAASRDTVRATINEMRKDGAPLRGIDAERAAKESMHRESAQAWTK